MVDAPTSHTAEEIRRAADALLVTRMTDREAAAAAKAIRGDPLTLTEARAALRAITALLAVLK